MKTSIPAAKISAASIQWDSQGQPKSTEFDDVYFNTDSGIDESRYVYINPSRLTERWGAHSGTFTLLETGFGTGLNFVLTLLEWIKFQESKPSIKPQSSIKPQPSIKFQHSHHLHYISIEKFPLDKQQIKSALQLFPQLAELSELLTSEYPLLIKGFHTLHFKDKNVSLTLIFDDVRSALPQLNGPIDAWYLDGFAPAKNPDMWTDDLYQSMARLSRAETSLATFTSAGDVRRGLKACGFKLNKVSGFGMKREMMNGVFIQSQGPLANKFEHIKPWLSPRNIPITNIAIIGAGIAGCTTAYALARRGLRVTVYDNNGIATEASGNPQGAMYAKLAAGEATHSNIYVQGYLQSLRLLKQQLEPGDGWDNCGLIQLASSEKENTRQKKFISNTDYPKELLHSISQEEASAISGLTMHCGGLYFPHAGWVSPQRLCQKLLEHPLIEFEHQVVDKIHQEPNGWSLSTCEESDNHIGHVSHVSHVIIACANKSQHLLPDCYLPTKSIRGQLTYLETSSNEYDTNNFASQLKTVLCGKGYIAPAHKGKLCLGASYNIKDDESEMRLSDHKNNFKYLDDFGQEFKKIQTELTELDNKDYLGRTGFRCTTPDYLPMAGPVLAEKDFESSFTAIRKNAARYPRQAALFMDGLYLNIGHGSRGLTSAPLCAELIASYINNENFPISKEHAESLLPGRFFIREMVRNKR